MVLSIRKTLRTLAVQTVFACLAIAAVGLLASPAAAEDSACPELTQTKYPFLTCEPNAYGGVTLGMVGYTPPLTCYQRMPDGECAASPEPWQLPIPVLFGLASEPANAS